MDNSSNKKQQGRGAPPRKTLERRKSSKKPSAAGSELYVPRHCDVLLGRGKSHLNHPGNKYFQGKWFPAACKCFSCACLRILRGKLLERPNCALMPIPPHVELVGIIACNRDRYFHVTTTMDGKRAIVKDIVRFMQHSGRLFLKEIREGNSSYWMRLSDDATRQKVAHALQYRQRCTTDKTEPLDDDTIEKHADDKIEKQGSTPSRQSSEDQSFSPSTLSRVTRAQAAKQSMSHDDDDDSNAKLSLDDAKSMELDASEWWFYDKGSEEAIKNSPPLETFDDTTWADLIRKLDTPVVDTEERKAATPKAAPVASTRHIQSIPVFTGTATPGLESSDNIEATCWPRNASSSAPPSVASAEAGGEQVEFMALYHESPPRPGHDRSLSEGDLG
jgi:hypothetical protein